MAYSSASYTDSVWFQLYTQILQNSLKSVDSLQLEASYKYACVAAILRLNSNYKHEPNKQLNPMDILYIRRAIKKGDVWSGHIAFPGGRHENNESLQCTVEREVMEEIGLDISPKSRNYKCLGYVHCMDLNRIRKTFRVICYIYIQCIETTPTLTLCHDEVADVSWFNLQQFAHIPLHIELEPMFNEKIWQYEADKQSDSETTGSRHGWTNMNVDVLRRNMRNIASEITNHVDLELIYSYGVLPAIATSVKYPGVVLHKNEGNENDFWLLWGMTYRFTGYVLDALRMRHYLRYKRWNALQGARRMKNAVLYYARIFKFNLNVVTSGIVPYFSKHKYDIDKHTKAKL